MPVRSVSASVPAPVGGWNARDPLAIMAPQDAVKLVNFIPNTTSVTLRNGFRVHTPSGLGAGAVETVIEYSNPAGARQLIAAANNGLFNCSTLNAGATSLGTITTSNRFQTAMFKDAGGTSFLVMFNGADVPKKYNGTTVTTAAYTTIATPANLIHPTVYKNRLYLTEKNTTIIHYGATNAVEGAVVAFDVGSLLKLGGKVLFTGAWSLNSNADLSDLFVIVSDMGECLVYSGTNPGAADWGIVGRYYLPVPIGIRAGYSLGADFIIITQSGGISMSDVLQNSSASSYNKITDKINNAFSEVTELYSANFGWECQVYPRRNIALVNIPVSPTTRSDQFVVNTLTGAWTRFTGWNTSTFSLFNENLYFGGLDGKIYQADFSNNDNGAKIPTELKTAFSYFGDETRQKQFLMVRPIVASSADEPVFFDVDVDFEQQVFGTASIVSSETTSSWDAATWDVSPWGGGNAIARNWYSVSGVGYAASLVLKADFQNVTFDLAAFNIMYKPAGYL